MHDSDVVRFRRHAGIRSAFTALLSLRRGHRGQRACRNGYRGECRKTQRVRFLRHSYLLQHGSLLFRAVPQPMPPSATLRGNGRSSLLFQPAEAGVAFFCLALGGSRSVARAWLRSIVAHTAAAPAIRTATADQLRSGRSVAAQRDAKR
jgi:hypothetical protein